MEWINAIRNISSKSYRETQNGKYETFVSDKCVSISLGTYDNENDAKNAVNDYRINRFKQSVESNCDNPDDGKLVEDHYIAYPSGNIYNFHGHLMQGTVGRDGYKHVILNKKNKDQHRVIAEAFVPNENSLEQVNHINGIKTDNRIEICNEDKEGKFIKCEQNRYGDSYRSPLSNTYFPNINDGYFPNENLRKLEIKLNKIFKIYTKLYYNENTIVSVYCWELGEKISDGFGVGVLIKNSVSQQKGLNNGIWESSNIMSVEFSGEKSKKLKAKYNLITSLICSMTFESKICGKINLSGSLTRKSRSVEEVNDYYDDDSHIENIGVLIEDLETSIRNSLELIFVMKTKEIIDSCRMNKDIQKFGSKQINIKEMLMKKKN